VTRAAESTHWYTREGQPAYTVKAKAGHERPTTLADARKLNLVPSVTTVIKSAAAPGLERWKLDQMMQAALTLPRLDGESEAAWIARVWTDSGETARKAAERGTAVHAAIQEFYTSGVSEKDFYPHVEGVCRELEKWSSLDTECAMVEQSFAHPLGFGGKVDICCTSPYFVADFKTKEFGAAIDKLQLDDLKTWDEQAMQIAAYREGLGMGTARGAIVYVSVTTPGLAKLIEIPEEELSRGWEMFVHLLSYWKSKNKFRCGFDLSLSKAA
jgi:hypothetical protein